MNRTRMGSSAAAALVALAASSAVADDLLVPQRYATVEIAATGAKPGDRIVVKGRQRDVVRMYAAGVTLDLTRARLDAPLLIGAPDVTVVGGRLRRGVLVTREGVTLVGTRVSMATPREQLANAVELRGDRSTLDGVRVKSRTGSWVTGVKSTADELTMTRSSVVGGSVGVSTEGDGATIEDSRFGGRQEVAVLVFGDDAVLTGSSISTSSSGQAVEVDGERAQVSGNAIAGDGSGLRVRGDDAQVTDNRLSLSGFGDAVDVFGDAAAVSGNDVTTGDDARGVRVHGADSTVTGNRIEGADSPTSLEVLGTAATVSDNTVVRTGDPGPGATGHGIVVVGDDALVTGNQVTDSGGDYFGLWSDGVGGEIRGNTVTGAGSGLVVCGCANLIDSNVVRDARVDGVVVVGPETVVSDTDVSGAGRAGVLLYSATTVVGGSVRTCGDGGVVALADGSTVDACSLSRNGTADIVALGACAVTGVEAGVRIVNGPETVPEFVQVLAAGFTVPGAVPMPTPAGD